MINVYIILINNNNLILTFNSFLNVLNYNNNNKNGLTQQKS